MIHFIERTVLFQIERFLFLTLPTGNETLLKGL